MIVTPSPLAGAVILDLELQHDGRGFFARTWCAREAEASGLNPRLAQASVSYNKRRGTLRGMHYQVSPHEEAKLVRCTRGSIHDVVIDLRAGSSSLGRHFAVTLSAENRRMLYVAEGFAHGFQTLEDDTEVCYQISEFYAPAAARGVRWDDPAFGIEWPLADPILNERDRGYPDFTRPGGGER
jgi:dTDP-4-dehydrorhamnose 3,5-epimerase